MESQKDLSHQMLIRHHECTQEMEFRHLYAVHKLRRDQQQKQHNTEWSSQEEYNKRLEGELNRKHALELKMQPKTLKVHLFGNFSSLKGCIGLPLPKISFIDIAIYIRVLRSV